MAIQKTSPALEKVKSDIQEINDTFKVLENKVRALNKYYAEVMTQNASTNISRQDNKGKR